jgi:hypothetical protein
MIGTKLTQSYWVLFLHSIKKDIIDLGGRDLVSKVYKGSHEFPLIFYGMPITLRILRNPLHLTSFNNSIPYIRYCAATQLDINEKSDWYKVFIDVTIIISVCIESI